MQIEHKKNTAYYLSFPMIDSATPASFKTGVSPVDTAYYKDGAGAWTSLAITDTAAEIGATGVYEIDLTAAEMNHDQVIIKFAVAGTADTAFMFDMRTELAQDLGNGSGQVALLTATQASVDAIEADTNELQTDDIPALIATAQADLDTITGADGVNLLAATQASIDAIEVDTADVAAVKTATDQFVFSTANQVDSNVLAINSNTTSAVRFALHSAQTLPGTVDTVTNTHTPTTTEFQADDITEGTADHYKSRIVIFTSGVLLGQVTDITAYAAVGGIGQFTVTAMTEAPANNDTFLII